MKNRVRTSKAKAFVESAIWLLAVMVGLGALVTCEESPMIPVDQTGDRRLALAQIPEEELFGGVFQNGALALGHGRREGGTTWRSSDGYSLKRFSGGSDWTPASVGMGPYSTSPGATKTFQFNLYNDGVVGQEYDVFYRMHQSGSGHFGEENGRQITVLDPDTCTKNCGPSAFRSPLGEAVPGGSYNNGRGAPALSGEVIQTLVVEDYPLHFEREGDRYVAHIRYFASLMEAWPVDVEFDITYESKKVNLGQTRRGLQAPDHEIEIEVEGKDRIKVKLKRADMNAALTGEGLLLEIPIVANPNEPLPESLDRVVLTVTR